MPVPKRTEFVRLLVAWTGTDRIVIYALLSRSWQAVAGLINVVLIFHYFQPEVQGFYYTFASLLALQSFLELGFYLVIVNVASHEWAHLELGPRGRITGNANALSRLISLGRFVFKWYAAASAIFVVAVGACGYFFFSQGTGSDIEWQAPWFCVVIVTGFALWTLPFNSLLEGCNQMATVNRFRLVQAMLGSAALWLTIAGGGGLWAAVTSAAVSLACSLYILLFHYRKFFEPFWNSSLGPGIRWRSDVWPMQWRLALQGMFAYFMYSLFNPVMFHYHGAAVAGQMGVTLQLANMLQALAMAWVQARVPTFGMLVARREYGALDRLWKRTTGVAVAFILVAATTVWLIVYGLNVFELPVARRLLGPLPTGLLVAAAVLALIIQCEAAYLRSYKREPLLVSGLASGMSVGFLVWWLGSRYGPTGAASAYLMVVSLLSLPLVTFIWFRCRTRWQAGRE